MNNKIEKYKEIRKNINIIEIKEQISNDIIQTIRTENINYPDIASKIGMTTEKFSNILLQPKNANGSELLLISDNIPPKKLTHKK